VSVRTYDRSNALFEQAKLVTPGGAQTGSKAPGRVGPLGAFPLYLDRGEGPYVWDVDDHQYVDWFNGNCAVTLGHANHYVAGAVGSILNRGTLLSLPTALESKVAKRLVDVIPCAEQVRFVKTGSEACAAAVRIARMATGRSIILTPSNHYHGWHDWTVIRNAYHPGIPDWMAEGLRTFRYNHLEDIAAAFAMDECRDIAAVMLEPTLTETPAPGFLEGLVELAHAHGALVIFDEMITGARWALGGAQEYFHVVPDLSTHGKAYANGFPLAFVCGRAELMQHAWPISGTFGGENVSLAACNAVLDVYQGYGWNNPITRIWEVGQRLMDGVNGICDRLDLPARMIGYPCRPVLNWDDDYQLPHIDFKSWMVDKNVIIALFQQELAQHGVLVHPSGWNPSAAHDSQALEHTLAGCSKALEVAAAALSSSDPRSFLRGELLKPAFVRQEVTA
jgi:glutamate-1-semialdehyde 2,1-aminomutase